VHDQLPILTRVFADRLGVVFGDQLLTRRGVRRQDDGTGTALRDDQGP
jgi:hypothetical protein